MFTYAALALTILTARSANGETPAASRIYLIHIKVAEETCGAARQKVLTAPTLATVENRECRFHVGGKTALGDEYIDYGTVVRLHVRAAGDGVKIQGCVEVSNIESGQDTIARRSTATHFSRQIELGKSTQLRFADDKGRVQTLDLGVEPVTASPPAELVDDQEPM